MDLTKTANDLKELYCIDLSDPARITEEWLCLIASNTGACPICEMLPNRFHDMPHEYQYLNGFWICTYRLHREKRKKAREEEERQAAIRAEAHAKKRKAFSRKLHNLYFKRRPKF